MPYKTVEKAKAEAKKDDDTHNKATAKPAAKKDEPKAKPTPRKAANTEREKHLEERDKFQDDLDSNRQWHRPQEHTFTVDVTGAKAKPIVGGTAAGVLFLDTGGEARLDSEQVHTLISQLQAAFQAVS